ncbi:MAG: stage 0 sporulation protein [Candidatus Omnitrophica bacterium]|nr:stage 0 sporulation protein [Candidatus Omnitrophota bacterium]MCM8802652.1 stage 0 sporulation protein [Candidatus Omnitrophota bacterium]
MDKIALIEIRKIEKNLYFKLSNEIDVKPKDFVLVEFTQGTVDYGKIYKILELKSVFSPTISGKVLRRLNEKDFIVIQENNEKKKEAFNICIEKIKSYNLPMRLIEADFSYDKTKLTFYYWAEGRIDFRKLVRDLAKIFNCRIEMRQIGLRDEAKIKGGYGICGRELCCITFLKEFESITMRMVKNQKLPLDMNKITGLCGRLLCCLSYEDEFYRKETVEKK